MTLTMRSAIAALAFTLLPFAGAAAQDYPNRPVRIILPYAAGGTGDIIVRLLGNKLSSVWGQPLVVENRTGAGGLIGTEAAARSAPDGYTLYLATDGPTTVAATLHKNLSYDWKRDFVPITMLAVSYQVMLVKATNPARNVAEFAAAARQRPGALNYGSIGIGSAPHLTAEIFKVAANVDLTHVPYRGSSAQVMTGLMAGDVSMFMNGTASSIPHIQSGNLRALAITSPSRAENLPDVATFTEQGMPSVDAVLWFALMAPAGTPPAVVQKLHADFAKVSADPEYRKALEIRGLEVRLGGPENLGAFMERDHLKFRDLIQKLGLKPDQ